MVPARDVLAYVESRLPGSAEFSLFKLLYYCQAWHLAWEGTPLFPERIEAWKNGPVAAQTWRERRTPGSPLPTPLPEATRHVVDAVVAFYGHLPSNRLVDLSHQEAPWREARQGLPDSTSSSNEITVGSMRRFYTRQAMDNDARVPRRPQSYEQPSRDAVLAAVAREAPRWKTTLDRLAQ